MEYVHLAFLAELGTKLDRRLYAIKGGCNLRFFFQSIRYSEDLDIDVETVAVDTLRRKVDRLLESRSLRLTLNSRGIEIHGITRPKQTQTTQRWKLGLRLQEVEAHTKIEFSRRGLSAGVVFEPVDPALIAEYSLTRTILSHYGRRAACEQKIKALTGRSATQSRDVFDLGLLLTGNEEDLAGIGKAERQSAVERALSIDFDTFQAQVLTFLSAELRSQYATRQAWEQLVSHVVGALDGRELR